MSYTPQYTDPEQVRLLIARDIGYKNNTAASMNDEQIIQAIADAEGYVDGVLRKKYDLPLSTPVPQLIITITEAIAAYQADLVWRGATPYKEERTPIYLRMQWAIDLLTKIDEGTLDPGIPPDPDGGTGGDQATVINPYPYPLFTAGEFFWPWYYETPYRREATQ